MLDVSFPSFTTPMRRPRDGPSAQFNWEGYEAANTIVSKIAKNEQYGQAYNNISAFVCVAVKNARDRIQAGYSAWKPEDVHERIERQGGYAPPRYGRSPPRHGRR